jgi:hypothetical protein
MVSELALGMLGPFSFGGLWRVVTSLISGDGSEALLGAGTCGVVAWNWFIVLNVPYDGCSRLSGKTLVRRHRDGGEAE